MPSNQEYKGKGTKGRNYDELSGVGTSSAGKTGTTGNLNDGARDGGVGTPDLGDAGNLQSAGGQPGGTPAQGRSRRSQSNQSSRGNQQNSDLASGPGDNAQRGDWGSQQSGNLNRGNQSQSDLGSGPGDDSPGDASTGDDSLQSSRGGGNMQSGGQGSRSGRNRLTPEDLDIDESL